MAHSRYPVMANFQGGGIKGIPNEVNANIKLYEIVRDGNWGKYLFIIFLDRMGGEGSLLH